MRSKRRAYRLAPLAAAIAVAGLQPALGQEQEESTSLSNIVVTAAGYEQTVRDAPASISVISREELERNTYRNVTDALRSIPGVLVTGSGNNPDISIRGMPADYTLLLVDGRRQGTSQVGIRGDRVHQVDWLPPLAAIERIEVIRGPMSTLYGSDAIGGVINVITRRVADEWHGSLRGETLLQEHGRSGNEYRGQAYLSGPIVEDLLGLHVTGQYTHRQEDEGIEDGYQQRDMQNLTARLTLTPGENHDFFLEASAQQRESLRRPSYTLAPCEPGDEDCTNTENRVDRHYVSLGHTGRWGAATSDSYIQQEELENRNNGITMTNTTANTSWVTALDAHILTLGAHVGHQELNDSNENVGWSSAERISRTSWALFVEDEWWLTDSFALTGGLRLDHDDDYGSHLSPRLYGVWHVVPEWTVKGGVSTGYRAPTLKQQSRGWAEGSRGGDIYGNPDLDPETSVNTELALLYHGHSGIEAGVTLFHSDFTDKILRNQWDDCPYELCGDDTSGTFFMNVQEVETMGVEGTLSVPVTEALRLSGSYTYTESDLQDGDSGSEGYSLVRVPRHLVSARIDWAASDRLDGWIQTSYRSRETNSFSAGGGVAGLQPAYGLADAGGSYQLTDQTQLLFGIYNLFDRDFTDDSRYNNVEDGRHLWLGINVDF